MMVDKEGRSQPGRSGRGDVGLGGSGDHEVHVWSGDQWRLPWKGQKHEKRRWLWLIIE